MSSRLPYSKRAIRPKATEPFFISRLLNATLCVAAILTYVTVSLVLLMETMGFDRGQYSTVMALTAMVSMAVSFSTPFARNMLIGILIGCSMLCILLLMILQPFTQIWHKRNSHNPKILWLRETIKAL